MTTEARSRIMRAVRSKNTQPELIVRRLVHMLGYRYRLHRVDLPGKPDIVFSSRHKVIFVHGCFWHGHTCGRGARVPKTNRKYWTIKVSRNRERDAKIHRAFRLAQWKVLTIWECQIKDPTLLRKRIIAFLKS